MPTNLAFPLIIDESGYSKTADYNTQIKHFVEQVLFTYPGERLNQPAFGTNIMDLVLDGIEDGLEQVVKDMVTGALQQALFEIVTLNDVVVETEEHTIVITVRYTLIRNQTEEVLELSNELPTSLANALSPSIKL